MKINMLKLLSAVAATMALVSPALADLQMPSNLRPLPEHFVKDIYQGRTLDFGEFRYFYDKDGKVSGWSDEPLSFAAGKWTLDKNQLCVDVVWKGEKSAPDFKFNACYDWFSDIEMTTYWTRISSSSDSSLVGKVFQGNPSYVRDGDAVSRLVTKATKQLGYN